MELKQLSYFVTIVQEGTFSAAAKKLHMTQPPLSYQMQLLEEELGVVLLKRGARKTELTDAGKIFYQKAETILRMENRTEEQMREIAAGTAGEIRIGLISSARDFFIQNYLGPYARQNPAVHFQIRETDTDHMMDQLDGELLDLAVVRTPFNARGLDRILLARQSFCAVQYGKKLKKKITLKELASEPLIVYRRWLPLLKQACEEELNLMYVCDEAGTCMKLMEEGLGIALLPASAVPQDDLKISIAGLMEPAITTDIYAVKKSTAYHSPAAEKLWQKLAGTQKTV